MARRAARIALALAVFLACGREDSPASDAAHLAVPPVSAPASLASEADADPTPPAQDAPVEGFPDEAVPTPASAAKGAPAPRPEPSPDVASGGENVPALEDLLRLPVASQPTPADPLASIPPPPADATPEERAAWRERIRIQRRSAEIGPTGPRQGTYSETDAAVRVPVSDRVQLEGGVRVNDREEPGREREESDRSSSSRVGVEVQF